MGRSAITPLLRTAATMIGLTAVCSAQQMGLSFETATFWDTLPIGNGGAIPAPGLGKAIPVELTADGLADVVFEFDDELHVLVNAGHWKSVQPVSNGRGFFDLAPFPRGNAQSDALLTIGTIGLSAWRWDGSGFQEQVLVPQGLGAPWISLDAVFSWSLGTGHTRVGLQDQAGGLVHLFDVQERRGPGEATSVTTLLPVPIPADATDLSFVDFLGKVDDPVIAFARPSGIETVTSAGQGFLAVPGSGTVALRSFASGASGTGHNDRLAWLSVGETGNGPSLRVVSAAGPEAALGLPGFSYLEMSAATDAFGRARLAITHTGIGALILEACEESNTTFCFEGPPLMVGGFPAGGTPVLADLHVTERKGFPDVLLFDEVQGQAVVHRGTCRTEGNVVGNIFFRDVYPGLDRRSLRRELPPAEPTIHVKVDLIGDLPQDATEVEILVYAWQNYGAFSMDAQPIAHYIGAPAAELDEILLLDPEGGRVRLPVIELRVHADDGGQRKTLFAGNYTMARANTLAYHSLLADAPPYCLAAATGPNVRGVIRISGLPLFFYTDQ